MSEVTRCKDCKYFVEGYDFSCCQITDTIVGEDSWCEKGEEK